jgi:hypothetical protein
LIGAPKHKRALTENHSSVADHFVAISSDVA